MGYKKTGSTARVQDMYPEDIVEVVHGVHLLVVTCSKANVKKNMRGK